MQDKPLGFPKVDSASGALATKNVWGGMWQSAIDNPKTSLFFATIVVGTVAFWGYNRMKDTEFSFGNFFKSKPKDTGQKGGDVKGKLGAEAKQESADHTKQEVGNIESSEGKSTLSQRMGHGQNTNF